MSETKNDTEARAKREIAQELKVMRDAIADVEHFSAATCDDGITNESDPDNCQRCYLEQALESVEKSALAERVKNLELQEELNKAIAYLANPQAFDADELGRQWFAKVRKP